MNNKIVELMEQAKQLKKRSRAVYPSEGFKEYLNEKRLFEEEYKTVF